MEEIKATLREIQSDLTEIKISQARIEQDVKHQVIRTDQLRKDVDPLKTHDDMWAGALKLIVIASLVVGVVGGVLKLFS